MAPAASVKVGEMSSKSRLQKIIKRDMQIYQKKKFRILQQSHQNSIIFSATKQRERERKSTVGACRGALGWRIRKGDSLRGWVDPSPIPIRSLKSSASPSHCYCYSFLILSLSSIYAMIGTEQSTFGFGFFLIYIFLWGFLFSRLYSFRIV